MQKVARVPARRPTCQTVVLYGGPAGQTFVDVRIDSHVWNHARVRRHHSRKGTVMSRKRPASPGLVPPSPEVRDVLDVDGGDVTCSGPDFEYRGACSHARELKAAVTAGRPLPNGFEAVAA